jgi:aldehyde dehydrogenase (NAD+)
MRRLGLFIGGAERAARSSRTAPSIDPATGEPWAEVAAADPVDVDDAVAAAAAAHREGVWRHRSREERAEILGRVASLVFDHAEPLAEAEVRDAGWTLRMAQMAAVPTCGQGFLYYGELCASAPSLFDGEEHEESTPAPSRNLVVREPFGVCACITPFNFSLAATAWKLAPALAAGNTVVLKPSPLTPVTALLVAELCTKAGVPDGVVNVVTGPGSELGEALVSHPDVAKVHFTGSTAVGRRIMERAAASLKKVTLELGGKSPFIVLDDAHLESTARGALFGSFFNSGQACESGTRVLVHRSLEARLVERMVELAGTLRLGDTMDPATDMGPLVSAAQLANTERYVALGLEQGARLVAGGRRPAHLPRGFYFEPTIFAGVANDMAIARDEIFGPVISVIPFESDDEAVRIANDTIYGLAASVWSADLERARAIAARIDAGTVWINDHHLINIRFPFGGWKQSGVGRELGPWGLAEFQQLKHVHVGHHAGPDEKSYFGILFGGE